MKMKINTPTKITIARIVIAILLLVGIFVLFYLDYFKVFEVSSLNLKINDSPGLTILSLLVELEFNKIIELS